MIEAWATWPGLPAGLFTNSPTWQFSLIRPPLQCIINFKIFFLFSIYPSHTSHPWSNITHYEYRLLVGIQSPWYHHYGINAQKQECLMPWVNYKKEAFFFNIYV